jgi:hypothetical protein
MKINDKTKLVTFAIIPLIIVLILAYDVYAIMVGGTEASISSLIIKSSYKMPFMTYMIGLLNGILVGHLFWRMRSNKDTKEIDNAENL